MTSSVDNFWRMAGGWGDRRADPSDSVALNEDVCDGKGDLGVRRCGVRMECEDVAASNQE